MSDTLASSNGRFRVVIQNDGNLVAYDSDTPYWASGTVRGGSPTPAPPADIRYIRANFCNLTDSLNRPIYTACLAAQSPSMQDEWIQREKDAGGTHYLLCAFAGYGDHYPYAIHFHKEGRWGEWLAALDRILAAGLVPVVMLDPGNAYPGHYHFASMLRDIPHEYYERCLWVPAFEPVKGAWTSRQFADAVETIRATLGPEPLMGFHLSPGRAAFASNPLEGDDPWQGDEVRCWHQGAGLEADVFLYQSSVPPEGQYLHGEDEWCFRAKEVADRFLGLPGAPDWFAQPRKRGRPTLVWMEATAYSFIRGQSSSAWAREVARYAQSLGFEGFGNGLP